MANVPNGYTPTCDQCGHWWMVAKDMERERDEALGAKRVAVQLADDVVQENKVLRAEVDSLKARLDHWTADDFEDYGTVCRERDEARTHAVRLRDELVREQDRTLTLERERDEAREEKCEAERDLNRLDLENERLRALLREVEWAGGGTTRRCCPCCYGHDLGPFKGHAPDCRLKAALEVRDGRAVGMTVIDISEWDAYAAVKQEVEGLRGLLREVRSSQVISIEPHDYIDVRLPRHAWRAIQMIVEGVQ